VRRECERRVREKFVVGAEGKEEKKRRRGEREEGIPLPRDSFGEHAEKSSSSH
jgi:hypothetical protein